MQSRSRYNNSSRLTEQQRRARRIRSWIIVLVLVLIAFIGVRLLNRAGTTTEITASMLPCVSSQDIAPFGNDVLYYDGNEIQCCTSTGSPRWSVAVGSNASFSTSETHVIVWHATQVYIIDSNGRTTYNADMPSPVQFCRLGSQYAAIVVGDSDTTPDLMVKDLNGSQQDEESEGFKGMMLLDVGFYGEGSKYMWTLALDVYNTSINTVLNTFEVARMNTGEISLGENLAYKVLFENNKLLAFTTQQMLTLDYKAVQDTNASRLVYGWKVIDTLIPDRGEASILLAPTSQSGSMNAITNLRIINGAVDTRVNLPEACIGSFLRGGSVYGVSGKMLYRSAMTSQRFFAYPLPLPEGMQAENYLGCTRDGHILVSSGPYVYAVTLPNG